VEYYIKMSKMVHIKDMDVFSEFANQKTDRMIKYNQNWLAYIVGGTGSGKSWAAISLADRLAPNGFDPELHLVFTPQELLRVTNSNKLKKGDIIIFDEMGVGMSSRDWYSIQNKLLHSVFQTFRDLNVGMIATVPALKFIDSNARVLFHNEMHTIKIHRKSKLNELKVYNVEYNNYADKSYRRIPIFLDSYGNLVMMPKIFVPEPKQKLIEVYERRSKAYKKLLREQTQRKLDEIDETKQLEYSCKVCGKTSFAYKQKDKVWMCRVCGEMYNKNPYKK